MKKEIKYPAIGSRLKAIRHAVAPGMTALDFSALIGFNYNRYWNWESGINRPMPEDAEVLCNKFGVTMDFIYRGVEAQLPISLRKALSESPLLKDHSRSTGTPD